MSGDVPSLTSPNLQFPMFECPQPAPHAHPASCFQRVLMNASIFLFCTVTVISEINASYLWLLNLLYVGQHGDGWMGRALMNLVGGSLGPAPLFPASYWILGSGFCSSSQFPLPGMKLWIF